MCGIDYCFSQRAAEEAMLFLCLACFHGDRTFLVYGENFSFCLGCFPVISYGQDNILRISYYFYIFPLLSCLYKSRPLFSLVFQTVSSWLYYTHEDCVWTVKAIYSTCCLLSFTVLSETFIERAHKLVDLQYFIAAALNFLTTTLQCVHKKEHGGKDISHWAFARCNSAAWRA